MNIAGQTALITGASRGIGKAIALALAQQGIKRLLIVARNRQKLAEVAAQLQAFDVEVITLVIDLTQSISINIALAQAWRTYGPITILVNCAGVAYQSPFLRSQPQQVEEEIYLNLLGMMTITRLIARRMASQQQGLIVNVSSLMGKVAAPTMATYSATKFAILGFSQALRSELRPYNVQVIALVPSLTDTDMVRNLQLFRWLIPLTPDQVAQALIRGIHNGSDQILVGWQSHLALWCQRLFPWLLDQILFFATPLTSNPVSHKTPFPLTTSVTARK